MQRLDRAGSRSGRDHVVEAPGRARPICGASDETEAHARMLLVEDVRTDGAGGGVDALAFRDRERFGFGMDRDCDPCHP